MNILHFILGKANPDRANGVNQVVYGLAKYQSLAGHKVYVIGISKSMAIPYEKVDRKYFEVEVFKSFTKGGFKRIKEVVANSDIVHLHGVWNFMNIRVGRYLEKIEKPYIITAHCGYSIDRLKQSKYLLKLLFHHLWQKRLYEHAAGIHALTREETTDIIRFCKKSNIFVVSNGVDAETYNKYTYQLHSNRKKIRFGYLGRLSIEKNVDNLIKAFALLPDEYKQIVELNLIGPVNDNTQNLVKLVERLCLTDTVHFVGGKYGDEKIEALLDLDVYIHPAYSDVVGIAVMEALALGLPTIVTRTSHMSYFYSSNAFIMVEPTSFDLCNGIQDIIIKKKEWAAISDNAKRLFESTFNWKHAVESIVREYKKLV